MKLEMSHDRPSHYNSVTLEAIMESGAIPARNLRSDLFMWFLQNRGEFAAKRGERTWAEWAAGFEAQGIRTNSNGAVTAKTVKQTWWRVRTLYEMEVADPVIPAEKAKVKKRRSPRREVNRIPSPRLGRVKWRPACAWSSQPRRPTHHSMH